MTVPEKQEIVLQAECDRSVVCHGLDQGQYRIDGFIQCRVGAIIDAGGFDQDVQLCDQLNSQHDHLLVKYVSGFRSAGDFLRQGLFVGQDRLGLFILDRGLFDLDVTHGKGSLL